jgi:hypothetical protein
MHCRKKVKNYPSIVFFEIIFSNSTKSQPLSLKEGFYEKRAFMKRGLL